MIFEQVLTPDLGCAAYVVGCSRTHDALVVDPPLDTTEVEDALARHDLRLAGVVLTHTHADHVSGHGVLALEHGVPISIHRSAGVDFPHEPLEHDTRLAIGDVELVTLHTPGHRPEHCAFAVLDHTRADEPWLVLTGDSLLVGDVARPDLAVEAGDGAAALHTSLDTRLLPLADGVEVFPGHVAGSLCGRAMSAKASTTIGFERRFNPMLQTTDERAFVTAATADPQPKPPNMTRIVERNRGPLRPRPSPLRRLGDLPAGTTPLDVRDRGSYVEGHAPGALLGSVGANGFATRVGWMIPVDEEIVVVAVGAAQAAQAAAALHAVGYDDVRGWVDADAAGRGDRLETLTLEDVRRDRDRLQIVDVRDPDESPPPLPDAHRRPLRTLTDGPLGALDPALPTAVLCGTGLRAAVAASVLARRGFADVRPVIQGGMAELVGSAV